MLSKIDKNQFIFTVFSYLTKLIKNTLSMNKNSVHFSRLILPISAVFFLCANMSYAQGIGYQNDAVKQPSTPYQLLLAGGALRTCSSFSPQNCMDVSFPNTAKVALLYELNKNAVERLHKFMESPNVNVSSSFQKVVDALADLLESSAPENYLSRRELFDYFDSASLLKMINGLADDEYFAVLDHLEVSQIDANGKRLTEQANVTQTKDENAKAIYQRFVDEVSTIAAGQQQTPQILVVTASSRDPFEVADFYESAFASLGVNTQWLPIDQALAYALEQKSLRKDACDYIDTFAMQFQLFDRARVYPDRVLQQKRMCEFPDLLKRLVENSQGIFFNGGDQSKTLNSLLDSTQHPLPFWQLIQEKVKQGRMIVGGTSAGTAVQAGRMFNNLPIPMISNGTSEQAIKRGAFAAFAPSQRCVSAQCSGAIGPDDLTFMPTGGSGLFNIGILDTHFSERDREGRLIALALETSARIAAGVDETTALLYRHDGALVHMEVIGAAGVFFVDGYDSIVQKTTSAGKLQRQYAGFSHYFFSGAQFSLNLETEQWMILSSTIPLKDRKTFAMLEQGVWRNSTRKYCGSNENTSWQANDVHYVLSPQEKTHFFIDKARKHCGYIDLPFLITYSE